MFHRLVLRCVSRTGVEMEALTGASVAALTIYDMCKAVNKEMVIGNIRVVKKSGGKSDFQMNKEKLWIFIHFYKHEFIFEKWAVI